MHSELPNDADGDALRRFSGGGSDLARPMFINFQVAVPDEAAAKQLGDVAQKLGYRVRVYSSPGCSLPWTCECSTRMLPTYDGVIAVQRELALMGAPFGARPDGWGSFGNATDPR